MARRSKTRHRKIRRRKTRRVLGGDVPRIGQREPDVHTHSRVNANAAEDNLRDLLIEQQDDHQRRRQLNRLLDRIDEILRTPDLPRQVQEQSTEVRSSLIQELEAFERTIQSLDELIRIFQQ